MALVLQEKMGGLAGEWRVSLLMAVEEGSSAGDSQ